jgi:hypothetical protein
MWKRVLAAEYLFTAMMVVLKPLTGSPFAADLPPRQAIFQLLTPISSLLLLLVLF